MHFSGHKAARLLVVASLGAAALLAQKPGQPQSFEEIAQSGSEISIFEVNDLEDTLKKNPQDLAARAKLLGYYYYQWLPIGEQEARAARRRHILWVIQNRPESPVAGLYEMGLDREGSALSDPATFDAVAKAWRAQMEARGQDASVLGNAAKFFQLNDRELAETALLKARRLEPDNPEWDWRLGYLYGLAVLGVDALAFNGQPASIDPVARDGPFGARARKALENADRALVAAVGGNVVYRWGTMLAPGDQARADVIEQAETMFRRALTLEPHNPTWVKMVQQMEAMRVRPMGPRPAGP
ncbi:MAG: hypothetical protein IPM24_14385 [Bryobacterales bacterium]|nr:hypothetical protein [Bryobacterales bacterium]